MRPAGLLEQLEALEGWGVAAPLEREHDALADARPLPDEAVTALELHRAVSRMLAALPADRRRVLVAVFVNGLSERDAAEALRWSRGRVRRQLAEALAALRVGLAVVKP